MLRASLDLCRRYLERRYRQWCRGRRLPLGGVIVSSRLPKPRFVVSIIAPWSFCSPSLDSPILCFCLFEPSFTLFPSALMVVPDTRPRHLVDPSSSLSVRYAAVSGRRLQTVWHASISTLASETVQQNSETARRMSSHIVTRIGLCNNSLRRQTCPGIEFRMLPCCPRRHHSGATIVAQGTIAQLPRAALDGLNRLSWLPMFVYLPY